MITEFYVYSRQMIELIKPHEVPHVIVSIRTPGDPDPVKLPTNEHTLSVLHIEFVDLNDAAMKHIEVKDRYEAQCFSRKHAHQILGQVRDNSTAERLIVHCDAGLSRSPGVAAALSKILTGDDESFFRRYTPNSRVYRTILEEHYVPQE